MSIRRLYSIVEEYIDAHDLCPRQQANLRRHVRSFSEWQATQRNGHSITAAINAWLASLVDGRSPNTVNGYRQSLLCLLRYATPEDMPLPRSDKIRRQRIPDKINPAFTLQEIRSMIKRARHYEPITERVYGRGLYGDTRVRRMPDGRPWSTWWEAFVRAGYDSGQYLADLRRLTWREVRPDGSATLVRHKTGRYVSFVLTPGTIAAAKRLADEELVLPWRWNLGTYFCREWRKFVEFTGVRPLTAKSLRRSAITYTYIEQGPEAARLLAGHASFATTARHYVDWSIAKRPTVQPPKL